MTGTEAVAPATLATRAAELFRTYRDGDEAKLGELVDLVTPILWHTARASRADHAAAEDIVQSTWLSLVRAGDGIRDPQTVLQWLIVTTRRDAWRVVARASGAELIDIEPDDVVTPARDLPEEVVLRDDADARLWQHIESLSERCRALLRVIAFADRPDYSELGRALGMPVGSIGPTRGRCLAKLRQQLTADPTWSQ